MEDYEKLYKEMKARYDKTLEAVKVLQDANPHDEGVRCFVNDNFPELRVGEDEKIRREIFDYIIKRTHRRDWCEWLERQEEKKIDETFAWKIYHFVEKWKQGMYGAIDLQEALDTYTIEP